VVGSPAPLQGLSRPTSSIYKYDLAGATPDVPVSASTVSEYSGDPFSYNGFGTSVDISGSKTISGTYGRWSFSSPTPSKGRAFAPWGTLNLPPSSSGVYFGLPVAISGIRAVVGESDKSHVYDATSATPTLPIATLDGSNAVISGSRIAIGNLVYDFASATPTAPFATLNGVATDISGTRVLVRGGPHTVNVYDVGSGTPVLAATLNDPEPAAPDEIYPGAIDGTTVVIYAPSRVTPNGGKGIIYVFASAPPAVTTEAPSAVRATTATLQGMVYANEADTVVSFEYGLTTNYDNTITATPSPILRNQSSAVSASISGLLKGRTYHYRVIGQSSEGNAAGHDVTVTTAADPATAITSVAGDISTNGATLSGSINPNGAPTTYYFEYGTTDSYGSRTPDRDAGAGEIAQDVFEPISGLMPGVTYCFRIVSVNAAGTFPGANSIFTTQNGGGGPTAPASQPVEQATSRRPVRRFKASLIQTEALPILASNTVLPRLMGTPLQHSPWVAETPTSRFRLPCPVCSRLRCTIIESWLRMLGVRHMEATGSSLPRSLRPRFPQLSRALRTVSQLPQPRYWVRSIRTGA
jgi:hypothetical protein